MSSSCPVDSVKVIRHDNPYAEDACEECDPIIGIPTWEDQATPTTSHYINTANARG